MFVLWMLAAIVAASPVWAEDAHEIVRKSVDRDQSNWERAKNYTFIRRMQVLERDSGGNVKKVTKDAHEVLFLYGEPFERKIEKDGKPLTGDDARKEQQKLDKTVAKRQAETEPERRKRVEAFEKSRREERDFAREVIDAYNFTLAGEELVNGRKAWIIDATPRAEYKPKISRGGMLKKFKGRMWIDQKEYQWARLDGEAIDTVSWGFFLARLAKGSRIFFEQVRVNDEVWMPKVVKVNLDARIALLKHFQGDIDLNYDSFRKFQTDSRVVSTVDLLQTPNQPALQTPSQKP